MVGKHGRLWLTDRSDAQLSGQGNASRWILTGIITVPQVRRKRELVSDTLTRTLFGPDLYRVSLLQASMTMEVSTFRTCPDLEPRF